jgi:aminoglycoside/choline kinase family phosphotransferase
MSTRAAAVPTLGDYPVADGCLLKLNSGQVAAANAELTREVVQPWLDTLFPGVEGLQVTPLAADASTRRYFRARWARPGRADPASCIIMVSEPWDAQTIPDFLTVGRHLQTCGVRIPQVYGVAPDAGCMALEDFGDRTLAVLWQDSSAAARLQWGREAMRALIAMHTAGTDSHNPDCPAFHLAFDVPKLLSELQFFRHHAIEGLWQGKLTDEARAEFDAACQPLCERLASQPRYFCHRDYHGWNLMAHHGTLGVLDFQDARMGPQPYDVVSLLVDRGTPELLGQEASTALVEEYVQRFQVETGAVIDRSEFDMLFDLVAVQRCLKAIGTFAFMTAVHQRQQYHAYIPSTLAYIRPLLDRYDIVKPLNALLQGYAPVL